jgi:hypothetical protein
LDSRSWRQNRTTLSATLKIDSHLKVVSKLDLVKTSECEEAADLASQILPKPAVKAPTWEPRSDLVALAAPPAENADRDERALTSGLMGVGRALLAEAPECASDSQLIPLAFMSTILTATCGWLWFLFQVGKWLLDF